jgi:mono/diheme cytochrome c family protein
MGTCLGCHGLAATMGSMKLGPPNLAAADFSYELQEMAHPNPNPLANLAAVIRAANTAAPKAAQTNEKKK